MHLEQKVVQILEHKANSFHVIAIMNIPSPILRQCLHPWTLAIGGLESIIIEHGVRKWYLLALSHFMMSA